MKVSAWETIESNTDVCYPDPPDGETWELNGLPKWVALVSPCCSGEDLHFVWHITPCYAYGKCLGGSAKTRDVALQQANEALVAAGWTLPEETS
jgi:hypothetical protein